MNIVQIVALCCNTTVEDVMSDSRNRSRAAYPRLLSYLFVRVFVPEIKFQQIEWIFERKHSTIIIGIDNVVSMLEVRDLVMVTLFNKCRVELTRGDFDRINKLQKELNAIKKRKNERRTSTTKR